VLHEIAAHVQREGLHVFLVQQPRWPFLQGIQVVHRHRAVCEHQQEVDVRNGFELDHRALLATFHDCNPLRAVIRLARGRGCASDAVHVQLAASCSNVEEVAMVRHTRDLLADIRDHVHQREGTMARLVGPGAHNRRCIKRSVHVRCGARAKVC